MQWDMLPFLVCFSFLSLQPGQRYRNYARNFDVTSCANFAGASCLYAFANDSVELKFISLSFIVTSKLLLQDFELKYRRL